MRAWVVQNAVVSFYAIAIAIAISWAYWNTLLAYGVRVESGSGSAHLPGLLGPAIAAILVTVVISGVIGIGELFGRVVRLQPPRFLKIFLALSPFALGVVAFAVLGILGSPMPSFEDYSHYPDVPTSWPYCLVFFAVLIVNGFGEEIDWRGFATEKLLVRYGWSNTTLLVAGLWAPWHLPVFWLHASMTPLIGPGFIGWAFSLLCGAFVLVHVYLQCDHNVLCVATWHTAFDMMVATEAVQGLPAAVVSTVAIIWGIAVAISWWRSQPSDSISNPSLKPKDTGKPASISVFRCRVLAY